MDNIDDLMRQKFDSDEPGERFEFKEEYWEQAEALLKLEDERRKRRGWTILGLLLLLLSLMLAGWWYLSRANGVQTQMQEEEPIEQTALEAEKEQYKNTRQINTNALQEPAATESKNAITRATTEIKQLESTKNSKNKTSQLPVTAQRDQLGHWKLTDANKPSLETRNAAETAPTTPLNQKNQANDASSKEEAFTAAEKETPAESVALLALSIIRVELTPLPVPEREMPEKNLVMTSEPPLAEHKKTAKPERKFSAGVSLLGSVNAPDQEGRRLGLAAGGYVQYNLNRQWALQLGGQYRLTPGYAIVIDSTPVTTNIEQLRYSFGYQKTTYQRETVALHHLEMPLALQWKHNRIGLEAGATLGYLLMVEDKTTLRQETSLEPLTEEKKRFVTGDRAPYKPFYATGFVGASYWFNNRISVNARAHYRFTTLEKPSEAVTLSRPGFVEAGIRYRLY